MMERQEKNIAAPASRFEILPDEIILIIMNFLGYKEWTTFARVSRRIREIAGDNHLWIRYFPNDNLKKSNELLCARAAKDYRGDLSTFFGLLRAVKKNGDTLWYASADLRRDPEIVLAALRQNGDTLRFASADLRSDPEIVLAAVRQNGDTLRFASADLRSDPEIVLAAVRQNSDTLRFASADLRSDPEIILAAVRQDCRALEFARDNSDDAGSTVAAHFTM